MEEKKERNQKLIADYQNLMRISEIARKHQLLECNVHKILKKAGVIIPGRDIHRTKNHNQLKIKEETPINPIILRLREKYRNMKIDKSERFINSRIGLDSFEFSVLPKKSTLLWR